MLGQKLQQKMLQKLSPQQIQMIKLLEIPTMQLDERIKKELEENPALEEGPEEENIVNNTEEEESRVEDTDKDNDEFSIDDYIDDDDDIPEYRLQTNNYSKDDDEKQSDIPYYPGSSFQEYLKEQLALRPLTEKQQLLGEYIIGNIDEDGYLRRDLDNIVDDMAFTQNIETSTKELEEVLANIQDLEPVGIGARSLQECLLIQLKKKDSSSPQIANAIRILERCFEEFKKRHFNKIMESLNLDEASVKAAIDEITKLNPKPGGAYSDPYDRSSQQTIIPDFILEYSDGTFDLHLNSMNSPELRLSPEYSEMLKSYSSDKSNKEMKEAVQFVKQKIDAAKWFIDAIKQRQNTLLVTMNAILNYQQEYFINGDETKLKPMVLKDIAKITDLDISTISRVANSKYIQTHFGIFPLKYFFSEGLQTENGEEVSTREIKQILAECVENEDKRKPLTDEKLMDILQEKGYQIARRTIAKYREQLNIPVARLRKKI
ncbi:MAG: RNA polymerase factor sigma-54 [Bacteroidales bacterium]|nr:RNA polymerase factor sigma-54 [Bacteroidales bacterium]